MTSKKNTNQVISFFPILDKYDISEVKIEDKGLERYINIETKDFFLGAPHANKLFGKSKISIIERLVSNLMRTKEYTGKKIKSYKVVTEAFQIIEKKLIYVIYFLDSGEGD